MAVPVRRDIDLGATMPCELLHFDIADEEFVRDYRLEVLLDDGPAGRGGRIRSRDGNPQYQEAVPGSVLATGQWQRRPEV